MVREKLMEYGTTHILSDSEMISVFLNRDAEARAKQLLSKYPLVELAAMEVKELRHTAGLTDREACQISVALKLAQRKQHRENERRRIYGSRDAFEVIYPFLMDLQVEHFYLISMRSNLVYSIDKISEGSQIATLVDTSVIIRKAIFNRATSIIIAHNHPSGVMQPSDADVRITRTIRDAAKLFDIRLADHIIVGGNQYTSLADEGRI